MNDIKQKHNALIRELHQCIVKMREEMDAEYMDTRHEDVWYSIKYLHYYLEVYNHDILAGDDE